MRPSIAVRFVLPILLFAISAHSAFAQVGISVGFGPPAIPVYEQPICPEDGYLWTPGYWSYNDDGGYFWVPGTWIQPPQANFLWTPGYWGWGGNAFLFHEGYWGPQVGFYGGINYGFGYGGNGYEGGRWEGGHFAYNTYVNRVNTTVIHNTYNTRVENISETRVSYNGGTGGVEARATAEQESYASARHVAPVAAQNQQLEQARGNPELRASANEGKPSIAATSRAGDFKSGAVPSTKAGGEYKAPPAARTESEARPAAAAPKEASDLQPHKFTPPNTGNAATDKKYQQQQDKVAAKQTQDHQKLQQQQDKEHQQAAAKNYSDSQKQQMETRHTQQTQQLEQKHSTQQQQVEQRQAPKAASHSSTEKPR